MNYDRERAMYEQECTEEMIRMRDPRYAVRRCVGPHPDPIEEARAALTKESAPAALYPDAGPDCTECGTPPGEPHWNSCTKRGVVK